MNDPNRLNTDGLSENEDNQILNAEQPEAQEDAAQSTVNAEANGAGNGEAPRWYSISYQNDSGMQPPPVFVPIGAVPPAPEKRGRGKKIALIAAVVAACMLFSAMAGFGGAMLSKMFFAPISPDVPADDSGKPGVDVQNGITNPSEGDSFEYVDESYDFAAALGEIVKNTDESLVGHANGSAGNNKKSLIEVTAQVKDSVVEITTTITSNRGGTISAGAGSGVIIHEDGIVVTNNHVIEGCDNIYVRLTNGDTYEAALRGTNEDGDIALLKITPQEGKPLTVARLGYSRALALGEEVVAIGNPLGELGGTVTNGIISATEREINVDGVTMRLLQTNAAINSGNSGGGLFNMAGELIGVVNAKYSATGVEGLGFAIPIDTAFADSFTDLLNYGYIRGIPSLGITLVEHTGGNFLSVIYGAYVYDAGEHEGFVTGDYIYSIDGTVVYGINTSAIAAIKKIVRSHEVGDVLTVEVKRGNETVTIEVTLQEYVPEEASLDVQE